jgi:SAM-dependent methyltransferase
MTQTWNAEAYAKNGAFVPGMAGGVVEWLAAKLNERILDLGCGNGALTAQLAEAGARMTAVDASAQMTGAARTRGLDVIEASAEELPFKAGTFDAVFSNAALHWVRDQDAMMREVHRVLRPGGRFVAEMGGHGNIAAIRVALIATLAKYGLAELEDDVNYYPTPAAYTRRLTLHGFDVERMELIPRPTPLGEGGLAAWLATFRSGVLAGVPEQLRPTIVSETVALASRALQDEDGNWAADYVRLRFVARASAHRRLG